METLGNIMVDVEDQQKQITSLKNVILVQQKKIHRLQRTVKRLTKEKAEEKEKQKYVLKKRKLFKPYAAKKGEKQESSEKTESELRGFDWDLNEAAVEGEILQEKQVQGEKQEQTEAEVVLSPKEKEAIEILAKVKTTTPPQPTTTPSPQTTIQSPPPKQQPTESPTPKQSKQKPTPKAKPQVKGVIIKEGGSSTPAAKEPQPEVSKKKGKEILIEPEKKKSRKAQMMMDEELARKLQEEEGVIAQEQPSQLTEDELLAKRLQKEEEAAIPSKEQKQLKKDEALARKLQEEEEAYAKAEKAAQMMKAHRVAQMKQKVPSAAQVKREERRKMINFLKNSMEISVQRLSRMKHTDLVSLYNKEMQNLQGDLARREEVERKLKTSHEHTIKKPFPDDEESEHDEEEEVAAPSTRATNIKRKMQEVKEKKRVVKAKPTPKETPQTAPPPPPKPVQTPISPKQHVQKAESSSAQAKEFELSLKMESTEKPIHIHPIGVRPPEIVNWDVAEYKNRKFFRIKRKDDSHEVFANWPTFMKSATRYDLDEMFAIGVKKYGDPQTCNEDPLIRIALEYLYMMYDPQKVEHILEGAHSTVMRWYLFERCGVHAVNTTDGLTQYMLIEKDYKLTYERLESMLEVQLKVKESNEMIKDLIRRLQRQRDELLRNM